MSDYELKRINALTEASAIGDDDVFALDSVNGTKKVKWSTIDGKVGDKVDGMLAVATVPNAEQLIAHTGITDTEPYFSRPSASIGDREFDTLVGGSLGWNQLCNGSSVTVTSGHKYYMIKGGTASVGASDGTAITGLTSGTDIVIDLTTLFGSTIADYIYSLEQATAGAGVAWVRRYLTAKYYPFCAPTLKHVTGVSAHVTTGFNQWDEEVESGYFNGGTGELMNDNAYIRTKNFVPCLPNTAYYFNVPTSYTGTNRIGFFDADKNYLGLSSYITFEKKVHTTPNNAYYLKFFLQATTYNHDICINLHWDGERDGEYEPYEEHSYPLDSSWVGMGIPKLDNDNKLYFDGDRYASDGTVTVKYAIRAYESGDTSDGSTMITDGTNTVYKLTTPTTSTATPFTSPQICDKDGTEEYVTTGLVPVGHETLYPIDIRGTIETISETPTSDGTYTLKCTVSGGMPTMEWVSE